MTAGSLILLLLAAAPRPAAAAESEAAAATEPAAATEEKHSWTGHFVATEGFRMRDSSEDAATSDLRLSIDASAIEPGDRFELSTSLGLWWIAQGRPAEGEPYGFAPVHASPDSPLWIDVYELAAQYNGRGRLRLARAGRQEAAHGRPGIFDGAYVLLAPRDRVKLFAFGGRTVHFFEIDQGLAEDWMGSAGFELRPSDDLRVEVDYRLLLEDVGVDYSDPGAPDKEAITDHTYGARLWLRRGDSLYAGAYVRGVNAELAFAGASARYAPPAADRGVEVHADFQTADLDELAEEDDPYHLILGESRKHGRLKVDAWRSHTLGGTTFAGHVGVDGRFLLGGDESQFNRNLLRAYALLEADDLLTRGPYANVVAEYDATKDDDVVAVGGAVGYARRRARVEAGTYYHRWSYTYYAVPEEISRVRGYYGDARVPVGKNLTLRGRYDYQIFDRTLHTLMVSLTQAF